MPYLLTACPFSRQVWHEVLSWLRVPCRPPERQDLLIEWWHATKPETLKPMRKRLDSITLLTNVSSTVPNLLTTPSSRASKMKLRFWLEPVPPV
jgi:hypothetical protein